MGARLETAPRSGMRPRAERRHNGPMVELVGREGVLRSTERFLDPATRRTPVLALEGDAGMGKSALWLRIVAHADELGQTVLQACPAQSETGLAYSAVTDLVGPVFEEVAARLPPPQASALGAALLLRDAERPVELRAVATAVTTVLTDLASRGPVLVAVDDVQWLDPASERVLGFVARRLPAGVGLLLAERRGWTPRRPDSWGRSSTRSPSGSSSTSRWSRSRWPRCDRWSRKRPGSR